MAKFFNSTQTKKTALWLSRRPLRHGFALIAFATGLGNDGICLVGASDELESISEVAPTAEGARKAILNAAAKARCASIQNNTLVLS